VREEHNLPIVFDSFVSGKAKKAVASNMRSGLCHTRLNALDFFRDNDLGNLGQSPQNSVLDLEHFLNFCGACVGAAKNENISASQKELLKWHWKLGIEMYRSQEMMHERHYKDPDGRTTILPAIIQPKNASARNCIDPPHQSCFLACAKKCSPKVSRTQPLELVPTKQSWVRHVSNNGCGINVSPKSNIIMVKMVFSLLGIGESSFGTICWVFRRTFIIGS